MKRTWSIEQKATIIKEEETCGVVETYRKHGVYHFLTPNNLCAFDCFGLHGWKIKNQHGYVGEISIH